MPGRDRGQDRRTQGRFFAAAEGQSTDVGSRSRRLFRNRDEGRTRHEDHGEKGHGRIETRVYTASKTVDWIESDRSYPGKPRFAGIRTLLRVVNKTEYADRCTFDTRHYISSAPLDIERLAAGARGHWGVESMHWLLDVEFKDDSHAIAPATAPRTWPSSAASSSVSCAPTNPREASKPEGKPLLGIPTFSCRSCK